MKYQKKLSNFIIQCILCPRQCKLKPGQTGFCHVRRHNGDEIVCETYGYHTGLAIDPIEKKPLYHFYPESKILSFGTLGCNMGCLFCQNFHISKSRERVTACQRGVPENIVKTALLNGCKSVAFTYNDPVIYTEYVIDTAKICRENGIKTAAVTSGYINKESAQDFFEYIDAANIDLKGFSEDFYRNNCLAHLQPVLDTIKYAVNDTPCHVELTTLLIEGENDDENMLKAQCDWILKNLGDRVPLHFSAFYPRYKFNDRKPTGFKTIMKAYEIAQRAGLKYVYTGNLQTIPSSTTYCPNCGEPLICRDGYKILLNKLVGNKCPKCGAVCDGKFI